MSRLEGGVDPGRSPLSLPKTSEVSSDGAVGLSDTTVRSTLASNLQPTPCTPSSQMSANGGASVDARKRGAEGRGRGSDRRGASRKGGATLPLLGRRSSGSLRGVISLTRRSRTAASTPTAAAVSGVQALAGALQVNPVAAGHLPKQGLSSSPSGSDEPAGANASAVASSEGQGIPLTPNDSSAAHSRSASSQPGGLSPDFRISKLAKQSDVSAVDADIRGEKCWWIAESSKPMVSPAGYRARVKDALAKACEAATARNSFNQSAGAGSGSAAGAGGVTSSSELSTASNSKLLSSIFVLFDERQPEPVPLHTSAAGHETIAPSVIPAAMAAGVPVADVVLSTSVVAPQPESSGAQEPESYTGRADPPDAGATEGARSREKSKHPQAENEPASDDELPPPLRLDGRLKVPDSFLQDSGGAEPSNTPQPPVMTGILELPRTTAFYWELQKEELLKGEKRHLRSHGADDPSRDASCDSLEASVKRHKQGAQHIADKLGSATEDDVIQKAMEELDKNSDIRLTLQGLVTSAAVDLLSGTSELQALTPHRAALASVLASEVMTEEKLGNNGEGGSRDYAGAPQFLSWPDSGAATTSGRSLTAYHGNSGESVYRSASPSYSFESFDEAEYAFPTYGQIQSQRVSSSSLDAAMGTSPPTSCSWVEEHGEQLGAASEVRRAARLLAKAQKSIIAAASYAPPGTFGIGLDGYLAPELRSPVVHYARPHRPESPSPSPGNAQHFVDSSAQSRVGSPTPIGVKGLGRAEIEIPEPELWITDSTSDDAQCVHAELSSLSLPEVSLSAASETVRRDIDMLRAVVTAGKPIELPSRIFEALCTRDGTKSIEKAVSNACNAYVHLIPLNLDPTGQAVQLGDFSPFILVSTSVIPPPPQIDRHEQYIAPSITSVASAVVTHPKSSPVVASSSSDTAETLKLAPPSALAGPKPRHSREVNLSATFAVPQRYSSLFVAGTGMSDGPNDALDAADSRYGMYMLCTVSSSDKEAIMCRGVSSNEPAYSSMEVIALPHDERDLEIPDGMNDEMALRLVQTVRARRLRGEIIAQNRKLAVLKQLEKQRDLTHDERKAFRACKKRILSRTAM
eukprot:GHVT01100386.1.p1 GENE.GHVT01100386.1~~GHVT01100386.1.p1  ORF type:complete len:1089 (-),score=134.59 GHVT01100386.1:707-3973(-)